MARTIDSPVLACPVTRRCFRALLVGAAVIVGVHVVIHLTWLLHRQVPKHVESLFDLAKEYGAATWLTVVVWFVLGGICFGLGSCRKRRGWHLLGVFFVYLSFDDSTMLHERMGWMNGKLAEPAGMYAWLVVAEPVFLLAGVAALRFLWTACAADPRARAWIVAVFLALGTALLIEVAEREVAQSALRWRGIRLVKYTMTIEETLELLAPIMMFGCLGRLLEGDLRRRIAPRAPGARIRELTRAPRRRAG